MGYLKKKKKKKKKLGEKTYFFWPFGKWAILISLDQSSYFVPTDEQI
jgi:hypothetical protein